MPKKTINKSQIKRTAQSKKINLENRAKRKAVRKTVKAARLQPSAETVRAATKSLDSMASKKIVSKNKASRDKSRLMRRLNSAAK